MTLNEMKARETEFRSFLVRKIKGRQVKHTLYADTLNYPVHVGCGTLVTSKKEALYELWNEDLWCQDMEYYCLMEFFKLEDVPYDEHDEITDWLNEVFSEEFRKLAELDPTLPTAALEG